MKVELINLVRSCAQCGRKESWPHEYRLLCECCGYHTKADINRVRNVEDDIKSRFWLIQFVVSLNILIASLVYINLGGEAVGFAKITLFISFITSIVSAIKIIWDLSLVHTSKS